MSPKQDYVQHLENVVRWLAESGFEVVSLDPDSGVITIKVRNPE